MIVSDRNLFAIIILIKRVHLDDAVPMKVYEFFISQLEDDDEAWTDPGYKCTREHLEAIVNLKIKIIESSEEEVEASQLDVDGRYFPK